MGDMNRNKPETRRQQRNRIANEQEQAEKRKEFCEREKSFLGVSFYSLSFILLPFSIIITFLMLRIFGVVEKVLFMPISVNVITLCMVLVLILLLLINGFPLKKEREDHSQMWQIISKIKRIICNDSVMNVFISIISAVVGITLAIQLTTVDQKIRDKEYAYDIVLSIEKADIISSWHIV